MKYLYLIATTLILSACNSSPQVDITLKAPGIKNGSIILSQHNEIILSQPIKNGSANINKPVTSPGYYDMAIIDEDKSLSAKNIFELYLENNNYTIHLKDNSKGLYPVVETSSKIQQNLSDYYLTENQMAGGLNRTIDSLITYLDTREAKSLSQKDHKALTDKTRSYQIKRRKMEPEILGAYIAKHPDNAVAAHIMARQYLDEYPKEYSVIFKKLTDDARNTEDGQKVSNKLNLLTGLLPGSEAPVISGITLNGKRFDRQMVKAKAILIEFWTSNSQLSEMNHSKILNGLILSDGDKKKFAMVSVSIDGNKETWERAVKLSRLTWLQVADFKGDNSPNVTNWMIKSVPSYFLVNEQWHIIKANIDIADVDDVVHEYFKNQK